MITTNKMYYVLVVKVKEIVSYPKSCYKKRLYKLQRMSWKIFICLRK